MTDPTWNFMDPAAKDGLLGAVRSSGHNAADVRFDVSREGIQYAEADVSDCPAVIESDPATLVLTGYARMSGGTVRGDRELGGRFRALSFPI